MFVRVIGSVQTNMYVIECVQFLHPAVQLPFVLLSMQGFELECRNSNYWKIYSNTMSYRFFLFILPVRMASINKFVGHTKKCTLTVSLLRQLRQRPIATQSNIWNLGHIFLLQDFRWLQVVVQAAV